MEYALIGVVAIVTIVVVAIFSNRLGVAAPLILVVVGVGYSLIPGVPPIRVEPDIILEAVLPPLLYAAAIQVSVVDFRRNLSSIAGLSITLIIVSALGIGLMLWLLLPSLGFPAAVALGAVVSPTDAVAATAVAKRLGLPPRLVTLLEGESLVNDASSLVLLKASIAVIAVSGAALNGWSIAGDFAFSVVVALAVGFAVGIVTVFVRSKFKDPMLDTAISFAVPFIAYIPAEMLGASGVLSVVVAGLYSGYKGVKYFPVQSRLSERLNWRTIQFILENGVFLLMGLQLKTIVTEVTKAPDGEIGVWASFAIGLLAVVILLILRAFVVAPLLLQLRANRRRSAQTGRRLSEMLGRIQDRPTQDNERAERRYSQYQRTLERKSADLDDLQKNVIDWRGGVVMTWAGMRGVVTVAAAQSLPTDTPLRPQLILIAFTVALVTLLVQGATLPALIRWTGITGTDTEAATREFVTLIEELDNAGAAILDDPDLRLPNGKQPDEAVVESLRKYLEKRSNTQVQRELPAVGEGLSPQQQYDELLLQVIEAERAALFEARSRGSYSSSILSRAQGSLDFEEARLQFRRS